LVVEVFHLRSPLLPVALEAGAGQLSFQGRVPLGVVGFERAPVRAHCLLSEAGVVWLEALKVGREASVA